MSTNRKGNTTAYCPALPSRQWQLPSETDACFCFCDYYWDRGTGLAIPDAVPQSQSKTPLLNPTPSDVTREKNRRNMSRSVARSRVGRGRRLRGRHPPRPLSPLRPRPSRRRVRRRRLRSRKPIARPPFSPAWAARMHTRRATVLRRLSRPAMSCSGVKPDVEDLSAVGDVSTTQYEHHR